MFIRKRFLKIDIFGYLFSQYFIKGKWRRKGIIPLLLNLLVIHCEQEHVHPVFHGERTASVVRGVDQNLHAANTVFQVFWVKQTPGSTGRLSKIAVANATNVSNTGIEKNPHFDVEKNLSLFPSFTSFFSCHTLYCDRKNPTLTCCNYCRSGLWFWVFQIAHCANNPKWEPCKFSQLTHQQLTSDITSTGD